MLNTIIIALTILLTATRIKCQFFVFPDELDQSQQSRFYQNIKLTTQVPQDNFWPQIQRTFKQPITTNRPKQKQPVFQPQNNRLTVNERISQKSKEQDLSRSE